MDPRHRAPFAHQSSSLDLHSQYTQSQPPLRPTQWAPPSGATHLGVPGVVGGPGFFEPAPTPAPSKLASAAAGLLGSFKMQRKGSDDGDYSLGTSTSTGSRSSSWDSDSLQRALPSAQTVKFVLLCFLWYATSAVSSNTGKVILNNFKFPVTLVIVQFAFVAGLCWIGSRRELGLTGRLRSPTKAILRGTLPMAIFQVGGHIFGSLAISRVPVSTVHTIKALSPLFTVLAYAVVFGVSYSPATYISILPLTLGVMLAVSFDISLSNFFGLICAFGSTIVFVSQNIFFKKVMPSPGSNAETSGPRLDKINLLYFSSGMAFLLMIPIWLYSDAGRIASMWFNGVPLTGSVGGSKVALYLFINGTVHFAQNVLAFLILSSTSPVTYSIASLVKRIAVICLAIIWFKQSVHAIQAVGIGLTAVGLYMYNNAKRDVEKGEKKMRQVDAVHSGMLPTSVADQRLLEGRSTPATEKPYAHLGKESPRPSYSHDFESVSKSSAIRSAPPPIFTMPPRGAKVSLQEPYPSPPASTASSPPLPAVPLARGDDTPSISLTGA
ncbi:Putative transporter1 [Vanrija pseudolonga]|uniref:Transporter1 n=1 Tax=Vanrija pseudolonga TaxID=143232 RepID=A0AAF0YH42_9TREE|nr:Putative transporter1 [Vanrija pseudolonga]